MWNLKNIWNKVLNLFGRANDWTLVWEDHGIWKVTVMTDSWSTKEEERKSIYSIFFSPSLNKYTLELRGYRANDHMVHLAAKMQLVKYNKDSIKHA